MTTVTVTKRGNVRLDGIKFYAVPDKAEELCGHRCIGHVRVCCAHLPCTSTARAVEQYRLAETSVIFVSKEEFLKHKENSNAR